MSARVVAYSAHPEDECLSLKVECLECGIEWGWAVDEAEAVRILDGLASDHNRSTHPDSKGDSDD